LPETLTLQDKRAVFAKVIQGLNVTRYFHLPRRLFLLFHLPDIEDNQSPSISYPQ